MLGTRCRFQISPRTLPRAVCFKPIAAALAAIVMLPPLSWFGAVDRAAGPFAASAQTSGCATSRNQIIQTGCNFPVLAQFEESAVHSYLALHGLPLTDAPLVYQYGLTPLRNAIRAHMANLILSYAAADPAELDSTQSSAYFWLQAQVQAEEAKYYAAANAEYQLWKSSPCKYKLDADVATQQGLQYDSAQWCYPNVANYFAYPEVPTLNYFLAVAWKKTYGSLVGNIPNGLTIMLDVQQQLARNGALYTIAPAFTSAAYLGTTVGLNAKVLFPFIGKEFYQIASAAVSEAATDLIPANQTGYLLADGSFTNQISRVAIAGGRSAAEAAAEEASLVASEAAEEALGFAAGASVTAVVAIAIFAIETAVEAGISAANNQKNLDDLATLPTLAAQATQNTLDLRSFLTTADGYAKAASAFIASTFPEFPDPLNDALTLPGAGSFYVKEQNASTRFLGYINSVGQRRDVALRGGWFASTGDDGNNLVPSIDFTDWEGKQRYATRVGPFQFLVERRYPLSTDHYCPGSPAANNISVGAVPSQCYAYVTSTLQMRDENGNKISVEAINPPTLTSATSVDFSPGVAKVFPVTFSTPVNDVPCILTRTGPLPSGVAFNTSGVVSFLGTASAQSAGIYDQTLTFTCGGSQGFTASYSMRLNVATNLAFTSGSTVNVTVGLPVNFKITTSGSPAPHLSFSYGLPAGLIFTDHNDGTATISGSTFAYLTGCFPPGGTQLPCRAVVADNGVQTIVQQLGINVADPPDPLTFTAPANGSTLPFPAGTASSYTVRTAGGKEGGIQLNVRPPRPPHQLPDWLTIHDNGDGTMTVSGVPPVGDPGLSYPVGLTALWCCGLNREFDFTVAVVNPTPRAQVLSTDSLAFLAGTKGSAGLFTNIQQNTGHLTLVGQLPPGLSYVEDNAPGSLIIHFCGGNNCPVLGAISGTPAPGSGGDYKVAFQISGPAGTVTQYLDVVIFEKPKIVKPDKVVFNAGVPSTAILTGGGYPLSAIGPFPDGVGYSAGLSFSDPTSSLPAFLKLVSGVNGAPTGTARLTSSAKANNIGIYDVTLALQASAAATPAVTDPATQLGATVPLKVYVVPAGDVNLDFKTDCLDLNAIKAAFGKTRGAAGYDPVLDVVPDGVIDVRDLAWVSQKMPSGTTCH